MPSRNFDSNIKSLLHFDFPYYLENNDGLRDEVSSEKFTRNNVKFVGVEIPNDEIISGTPKFGYRCPSFSGSSSFISATNNTGIFTLIESGSYEFGFFIRVTSATAGRVLALKDSSGSYPFAFSINADRKFLLAGQTSSTAISLNTWAYILIRITGGNFYAYLDGVQILTGAFTGAACNSLELGGFVGQIDEFIFRHSTSSSTTPPTQPEQAQADINSFGSFGNGRHGSQSITSTGNKINSYAIIKSSSGKNLVIDSWTNGAISSVSLAPSVGDEVMIHITQSKGTDFSNLGNFAFKRISAINGNNITLDSEITDFNLSSLLTNYYAQIITVPNFKSLSISNSGQFIPLGYSQTKGGGIIAFRVSDTFTLDGQVISSGYGTARNDTLQLTHASIIKNFVLGSGGNIFIAAKNFNASSTARIGATWDGSAKGGTASIGNNGTNGGAGYGGGGGSTPSDRFSKIAGGNGGVGGGGGGGFGALSESQASLGAGHKAGDAGKAGSGMFAGNAGTGGGNAFDDIFNSSINTNAFISNGGIQGQNPNSTRNDYATGGGGAGGNASGTFNFADRTAGSNVIILAEKFSCDASAISTGGRGGTTTDYGAEGGGGTGFCYIACKEMK